MLPDYQALPRAGDTGCAVDDGGMYPDGVQDALEELGDSLEPLRLLDEIRAMQHHLAALAEGERMHAPAVRDADLTEFLAGLALGWKAGEVRPTRTARPRPARTWRSRKDPFEEVWLEIASWLEAEPDQIGVELFARLQRTYPGRFPDGQLRTLQRRLADWRLAAASRLAFRDLHPQPPIHNLARSQLTHEVEGGGQPAPLKAEVPAPCLHASLPQHTTAPG